MVSQTIKQNVLKNKALTTSCSYDAFGFNIPENRILKMAQLFTGRYLAKLNMSEFNEYFKDALSFISPAFEEVQDEVLLSEVKHLRFNPFYKEYKKGIELAQLILKRFGYNISNTQKTGLIEVPPFWIDMSKLFELYVLGLLKDRFPGRKQVQYQFTSYWNYLDYLINTDQYKIVADAKYKQVYIDSFRNEDIRQVSGYSRLSSVYKELNIPVNEVIDCLIIYPNNEDGYVNFKEVSLIDEKNKLNQYIKVYKLGVKLPII